jgi:excisionase family DNA binding protein
MGSGDDPSLTPEENIMPNMKDSCQHGRCMIDIKEVAALTSLSTRTIARLTAAGRIPGSMKLGGARRYSREKILRWLDRGTSSPHKKEEKA